MCKRRHFYYHYYGGYYCGASQSRKWLQGQLTQQTLYIGLRDELSDTATLKWWRDKESFKPFSNSNNVKCMYESEIKAAAPLRYPDVRPKLTFSPTMA